MTERSSRRPNILYVMTDQQHYGMMSCTGNSHVRTPAMDRLAERGVRFDLACSANAVCLPARTAMMTGHFPSHFGIGDNADGRTCPVPEPTMRQSVGWLFRDAGYETGYGGKTHWPCNMNTASIGFQEVLTRDSYDGLADEATAYLKRDHDRPFLLVVSFHNPHDICLMAIDAFTQATGQPQRYPHMVADRKHLAEALRLPDGLSREEFFETVCPPLPDNFEIPAGEPPAGEAVGDFQHWAREHWTEEDWRLHRWAYARLTERVDGQVGRVLDALRSAGLEDDTLVLFSSDHGDMDGAHRLEHKLFFYDEASRVPFVISGPGVPSDGRVDRTHLVSASLDLVPTMCDFVGIDPPADLPGRSVRGLCEGQPEPDWRTHLVIERHNGRMIRDSRYKYGIYNTPERQEELYDTETDPGEMRNAVTDPANRRIVEDLRRRLRSWVEEYGDTIGKGYVPA
jgi:choline-sulfatase